MSDAMPPCHRPRHRGPRLGRRALLVGGLAGIISTAWPASHGLVGALPARAQAPALPHVGAAAVYTIDIDASTELYALNPDERRPTGSTTKIATALVTIGHAALDDTVLIDASDEVDITVYSHMGVAAGDTLSVEQLLYGLLLPSGSDAARALARHVGATLPGGDSSDIDASRAAFFQAMNDLAASLGLENSRFVNASGDDADGQYSSARDLARLATEALGNETLTEIVRTPTWESVSLGPEQRHFLLHNVNILLNEDPDTIGVKTGATPDAGTCLVSARRMGDGNRVVTVVLGSDGRFEDGYLVEDGRWEDTRAIVSAMNTDYRWISLATDEYLPGLSEELAVWQATVDSAVAQPVSATDLASLRYRLILGPEGAPGSEVGRIVLFSGSEPIAERPVFQAGGAV